MGFPYITLTNTAYIGEYLHFRYLKCLVMNLLKLLGGLLFWIYPKKTPGCHASPPGWHDWHFFSKDISTSTFIFHEPRHPGFMSIWMLPKIVDFPPKSSILIGFSIINHLFWGTPIFGNTHIQGLCFNIFSGGGPASLLPAWPTTKCCTFFTGLDRSYACTWPLNTRSNLKNSSSGSRKTSDRIHERSCDKKNHVRDPPKKTGKL